MVDPAPYSEDICGVLHSYSPSHPRTDKHTRMGLLQVPDTVLSHVVPSLLPEEKRGKN